MHVPYDYKACKAHKCEKNWKEIQKIGSQMGWISKVMYFFFSVLSKHFLMV